MKNNVWRASAINTAAKIKKKAARSGLCTGGGDVLALASEGENRASVPHMQLHHLSPLWRHGGRVGVWPPAAAMQHSYMTLL